MRQEGATNLHVFGLCLLMLLGCGRTELLSGPDARDATVPLDPLQGVWVQDLDVPGPRIYTNRQLEFEAGAWEAEVLANQAYVAYRQIDMGAYVVNGNRIEMTIAASSCQGLKEVANPSATFERHGDKMIVDWKDDEASEWAETMYLLRAPTLSDLGQLGCRVGYAGQFLPNPISPVP
jgi:hypothetical protein